MDHFVIRNDVGLHKVPSFGEGSWVLLLVEVAGHPPFDEAKLRAFFSEEDPNGFISYYRTASLGRFRPRVTVLPTFRYATCPLPEDRFPGCVVRRGDASVLGAGMDFLRELVRRADQEGTDFSRFDLSGRRGEPDGYADGVMVLLNVPFAGIAFPMGYFNDGDNLAGGTGGPLIVDGVKISHLAIGGDANAQVLVHEAGHVLGLTDLYDESNKYDGLQLSYMGHWGYGPKIPLPDAETRYRLRWGNVHQVSGRQRIRIAPALRSGDVVRLGTGDEYFLVENRGPGSGLFEGELPVRGLAVFHVDRRVRLSGAEGSFVDRTLSCVNCNPWHPYIRNVQADGLGTLAQGGHFSAEEHLFRTGSSLDSQRSEAAFSQANPVQSTRWYSGEASGISLRDVWVFPNGEIDATFEAPEADLCADPLCEEGEGCLPVTCGATGCGCRGGGDAGTWLAALLSLCGTAIPRRRRARLSESSGSARPH
jgi:M6 family metalloprotease-like protein